MSTQYTISHGLKATAIILLAPLSLLHAADWPQWGGTASKNMVSQETHLPETFEPGQKGTQGQGVLLSTTRNVTWVARTGDFSCGTPTVAAKEMKRLSQIRLGTRAWVTPVAANGTLYVASRNYLWAVKHQDAGTP